MQACGGTWCAGRRNELRTRAAGAILPMTQVGQGALNMSAVRPYRWMMLLAANALIVGVLGFYSTSGAAPQAGQPPFNNAVEQRESQLQVLREIRELLKE